MTRSGHIFDGSDLLCRVMGFIMVFVAIPKSLSEGRRPDPFIT